MFFSILQIGLVALGGAAAFLFGAMLVGFSIWKKMIRVKDPESLGIRYKSKAAAKQYDVVAQWAMKYVNPVALIWVGSVALGAWVIIRVVVSFL